MKQHLKLDLLMIVMFIKEGRQMCKIKKFSLCRGASGSKCEIADIDYRGGIKNDSDNETTYSNIFQVQVKGIQVFAENAYTSLDAQYLVINSGTFQIGTKAIPNQHNVKITIRGEERAKQYPNMGNKMIGCNQFKIDRTPSWTLLSQTTINDSTITVDEAVNQLDGDQIIITSSNQVQSKAEVRKILALYSGTIIMEFIFTFKENKMKALKQELKMQKKQIVVNKDIQIDSQLISIMMEQFQTHILETIPFKIQILVVQDLQSVSHLDVTYNICYNGVGHAIYIQNGNEMYKTFEHNLVAVVKSTWQLYQSDATASAFWITNSINIFFDNRVGGAEQYEFYLAFKSNPSGVASTSDVCLTCVPFLNFINNAAHSTGRIGLRIGTFISKVAQCVSHRNNALDDRFRANPSVQTTLSGLITWANAQIGVLADNLGNVLIENVLIASSKIAGYQQHKANFSAEDTTNRNFVIFDSQTNTGLIVPRANGFLANTVRFANFQGTSTLNELCSACKNYLVWVTGGKNTNIKGIKMINSASARIIHWNIFWDLDGTLTNLPTGTQIVGTTVGQVYRSCHLNTQVLKNLVLYSDSTILFKEKPLMFIKQKSQIPFKLHLSFRNSKSKYLQQL
ncbi:unnamed protein product [Paramecium pentaurelia]|uniref:G8 domain-containing protein n=1 Tax=Paramecium pentaurelia TaxID=43138 RepID=A0A8S1X7K9_9CILI|nr:unnamed protein product [Paramecium pentaurelia]